MLKLLYKTGILMSSSTAKKMMRFGGDQVRYTDGQYDLKIQLWTTQLLEIAVPVLCELGKSRSSLTATKMMRETDWLAVIRFVIQTDNMNYRYSFGQHE